jgi:hypothetical protein
MNSKTFLPVIIFFFLSNLVFAQPFDLPDEYKSAVSLREQGYTSEALDAFTSIVAQNAGTQLGGFAKYQIYDIKAQELNEVTEAVSLLEEISGEYVGTPAGLTADMALIDERYYFELERWLQEVDSLLETVGGASVQDVINGSGVIHPVLSWEGREQEWAFMALYENVISRLGVEADRQDDALAVTLFLRGSVRNANVGRYTRDLIEHFALKKTQPGQPYTNPPRPTDLTPPTVILTNPSAGEPLPEGAYLTLTLKDGDFRQSGLDFTSLQLLVDGVDVTEHVLFRTTVNLESVLVENSELEILEARLRIEQNTSTGSHQGLLKAKDQAGNLIEFPFVFEVSRAGSDGSSVVGASQDSTLTQKHPHQNEGANPLLTLEKIQGKASRCAVAFDLANENTNGLTKATLVLNIDPASHVTGWGNGETVSALALSADWVEGNGKSFGIKKKDAVAGSGSGTTWFSPIDENISNGSANSASSWNGAGQAALPATAPPVIVTNHSSGTLEFDVTADVLNGANSWLVLKDQENRGSQISFFSKESGEDLSPKLVLDFGDQVAGNSFNDSWLLNRLGFGSHNLKLKAEPRGSERPTFRKILQQNPSVAIAGESLIGLASGPNPVLSHASQTAYRMWLAEGLG